MKLFTKAFYFMDTHGVPLTLQVEAVQARGTALSLPHFYRDAMKAGWKPERALAVIEEALVDGGTGREYVDAALEWLKSHRELPGD
jgi:hypothetical protein